MGVKIEYTEFTYSKKSLTPSDYDRIKSIDSKKYLSDLWSNMHKEKKQYNASRRKIRLICVATILIGITVLVANIPYAEYIAISSAFAFFILMSEFLSSSSFIKAIRQNYDSRKLMKEQIDKTRDYEDYYAQHLYNKRH